MRKRIAGMTMSSSKAVRSIIVQVTDERDMELVEQQLDSLLRQRLSSNQPGTTTRRKH